MTSVTWALLPMSFQVPRKEPPQQSSHKERCSLSRAFQLSLKIPSQWTLQVPQWAPTERDTRLQNFLPHLSLKVLSMWAPLHVPQQGPYGERSFISRANGLFLHLYLSKPPVRSPPTKNGEIIWSISTEPHVDRRPTYNGVRPGSPRGSFTTLQSLPQCHAAFSTVPSILAWVDQSPISQHVS